jgi:hypothetical protein
MNSVTDHIVITNLETGSLGQFIPNGKPVTILLVNLLSTNVNGDILDEAMANIVNPSEANRSRSRTHNFR